MAESLIHNYISIVEYGSNNEWTWEKYSNGTIRMWGYFTGTVSPYWTGSGYGGYKVYISYPSEVDSSIRFIANFNITVGNGFTMPALQCVGANGQFECIAWGTTNTANQPYRITLQATGRWK